MKMKFRPQRGGLSAVMKEMVELDNSYSALEEYLRKSGWDGKIRVEPYGYDKRINWDTYIVLVNDSPVGFTNSPLVG